MKWDIILEMMDGRREEATLARSFLPEEGKIKVILARDGIAHSYDLAKICCVLMIPRSQQLKLDDAEKSLEEVVTLTGQQYRVAVSLRQSGSVGFYGLLVDAGSTHRLIFFNKDGVKMRRQERCIGEILEENGVITHFSVEKALEKQRSLQDRRLGDIIAEEQDVPRRIIENVLDKARDTGKVKPRMKVGDILIEAGLVTREQVDTALSRQSDDKKKKIGALLIEEGLITENQLLAALAVKFRLPFADLDKSPPAETALHSLPLSVIKSLGVIPLEDDGKSLLVATSEPTNYTIAEMLRFHTKLKIEMVAAASQQIADAISKYYPEKESGVEELLSGMSAEIPVLERQLPQADVSESDSQIVILVNTILLDGFAKEASDIHFEPGLRDSPFQVRYRLDGICRVVNQIPATFKKAIISRIKIMANLDISEHRRPQSGKIVIWRENNRIEYRVEITPTAGGNEDAVLRILPFSLPLPLEEADFSENNFNALINILSQPYGVLLCVGPTGSGKTTTLHSALRHLNTPEVKIWTVEDPVEITQEGLRQVQVQTKIGLTFQEVLRSFLRSDPDIIMIGEMRDRETAKTAIEASLTGHLVLSTLHTNSAPETVSRLIEMGMDPFNFADSLLGVLAQRLARRLCDKCKRPYHPDRQEYDELVNIYGAAAFQAHGGRDYCEEFALMRRIGCDSCNGSGYKGRVAIHELLVNSEGIKKAIRNKAMVEDVRELALGEGMRTLLMDGVQKVFQGLTDVEEIVRICRQ
ncbi:MAG: GspE/PulE family protein [Syntrophales bacterium]